MSAAVCRRRTIASCGWPPLRRMPNASVAHSRLASFFDLHHSDHPHSSGIPLARQLSDVLRNTTWQRYLGEPSPPMCSDCSTSYLRNIGEEDGRMEDGGGWKDGGCATECEGSLVVVGGQYHLWLQPLAGWLESMGTRFRRATAKGKKVEERVGWMPLEGGG